MQSCMFKGRSVSLLLPPTMYFPRWSDRGSTDPSITRCLDSLSSVHHGANPRPPPRSLHLPGGRCRCCSPPRPGEGPTGVCFPFFSFPFFSYFLLSNFAGPCLLQSNTLSKTDACTRVYHILALAYIKCMVLVKVAVCRCFYFYSVCYKKVDGCTAAQIKAAVHTSESFPVVLWGITKTLPGTYLIFLPVLIWPFLAHEFSFEDECDICFW